MVINETNCFSLLFVFRLLCIHKLNSNQHQGSEVYEVFSNSVTTNRFKAQEVSRIVNLMVTIAKLFFFLMQLLRLNICNEFIYREINRQNLTSHGNKLKIV